ncbi:ribonuclease E/G [Elioraea sp.]|uniref:ribonuclease E/G n=1 Tax=Elioraea sp. TaxID=2185103 RepID=UPI0025BAD284|nr:ribonuclease E/G [Elioraea sp.]
MDTDRLLIAASPGERRLARLRAGRLVAYTIERTSQADLVGALCHARVTAVAQALAGAFIAIGGGAVAFLPADEADPARADGTPARPIGAIVTVGQALPVRITRAPMGGKGSRASARLDAADREAALRVPPPALVSPGPGAVARALADPPGAIVTDDPDLAATLRAGFPALAGRIATAPAPLFDAALEEEIEGLGAPEVPLPRGGRLAIAITAAVTTIDIDTGSGGGGGGGGARAVREAANRTGLLEAARQVALRSLSGNIVIDLAGLPGGKGGRAALLAAAEAAFAATVPDARVLGFSRLGLLEVVRPRIHPALAELLGTPASGVVPSPLSEALAAFRAALRLAAEPGAAPRLVASRAVVAAARSGEALAAYAAKAGRPLALVEEPGLPDAAWRVEDGRRR